MGGLVGERVDALVCHAVAELLKGRLVLEMSCIVKSARCGGFARRHSLIHTWNKSRAVHVSSCVRSCFLDLDDTHVWNTTSNGQIVRTRRVVHYVRSGDACCRSAIRTRVFRRPREEVIERVLSLRGNSAPPKLDKCAVRTTAPTTFSNHGVPLWQERIFLTVRLTHTHTHTHETTSHEFRVGAWIGGHMFSLGGRSCQVGVARIDRTGRVYL